MTGVIAFMIMTIQKELVVIQNHQRCYFLTVSIYPGINYVLQKKGSQIIYYKTWFVNQIQTIVLKVIRFLISFIKVIWTIYNKISHLRKIH